MKRTVVIASAILLTLSIVNICLVSVQPQEKAAGCSEWVARNLAAIQTIKVGMTRRDLLKLFTVEGGFYNRNSRTYVLRECPYIKVDVGFEPVGKSQREGLEDKITRMSKPYLAQSVLD